MEIIRKKTSFHLKPDLFSCMCKAKFSKTDPGTLLHLRWSSLEQLVTAESCKGLHQIGLQPMSIICNETMKKKRHWSKRRNCLRKRFYSFKYKVDHANVCFFFLNSLWACSHSLNNINSFPVIPSVLLTGFF